MVEVTLVCLAALLGAPPAGLGPDVPDAIRLGDFGTRPVSAPTGDAGRDDARPSPFRPAADWDEVVIRAQSLDSPYYDELPAPGTGTGLPQYPYTPTYPTPGTTVPGNPPEFGAPAAPGGFGGPLAPVGPSPYDPFVAPPAGAPGPVNQFGVNGPQPYRFGPRPRFDFGYIAPAEAGGGYGEVDVFEFDADMPWASPAGTGDVFTFTPQFDMRLFDGPGSPPGRPGFPNDLYRFGWDFEYAWTNPGSRWSWEVGFNPSINTDFERSLTHEAINWDGRAVGFYKASPTLTVALGAMYWDRVDDRILPYAGVIWLPNDRLELRLVFPDPRISYFIGHMWGKPTWVYARAEYDVEAYEVEVPPGTRNQIELEDWRFLLGARKEQGWGDTF
ncbi:MAG TPA: hypothetical protein VF170_06730, partial [Planctomycetaceae bacterium]